MWDVTGSRRGWIRGDVLPGFESAENMECCAVTTS